MIFCLDKELKGTGKKVLGGGGAKQRGVVHDILSLVQGVGVPYFIT